MLTLTNIPPVLLLMLITSYSAGMTISMPRAQFERETEALLDRIIQTVDHAALDQETMEKSLNYLGEYTHAIFKMRAFQMRLNLQNRLPRMSAIVLHSRPGTDGLLLARAMAKSINVPTRLVHVPDIETCYARSLPSNLERIYTKLGQIKGPKVIIFDQMEQLLIDDTIGKYDSNPHLGIYAFCSIFDRMERDYDYFFIGTTNQIDWMHDKIRSRLIAFTYTLPSRPIEARIKLLQGDTRAANLSESECRRIEKLLQNHDLYHLAHRVFEEAKGIAEFRMLPESFSGTITMHDVEQAIKKLNLNPAWHERAKKFMVAHWALILEGAGYGLVTQLPVSSFTKKFIAFEWCMGMRMLQLFRHANCSRHLKTQYELVDVIEEE